MTKSSLLVEGFDEALTVTDLSLATARTRLADMCRRQRGRYIVVASSGTTGEPAIMPFSRHDWRTGMAYMLRSSDMATRGMADHTASILDVIKERPRLAGISTLNPIHVSSQLAASFHSGLVPSLILPASMPLDEQVEQLNCFQPTILGAYPSALDLLVEAAVDGGLKISPMLIFTGGETVTVGIRRRVQQVWGRALFDFYGLAETLIIAGECREHKGLHLYEDAVVLEVVDENGQVLPPGERGAGILVTSLINKTLPIIRYAVSDLITLSDEPCPCGLPFRRILAIEGRREELLRLRKPDGKTVRVHPFVIESPIEEMASVRRFQISSDERGDVVIVVVPANDEAGLSARVTTAVAMALRPLGLKDDVIHVKMVTSIESQRSSTDKLIRVQSS
ncbi:MAG: phenylacetate--CoA ligase family protein [Deltaproteobacteria bacterium]|nr:MAG: phenylacetate--CoA ligase family protein [Deltaproteobacteria bacterium]